MKKLLYSAAVLALTFFMSGCSLEETPLSKFDEGEAYKSATLGGGIDQNIFPIMRTFTAQLSVRF